MPTSREQRITGLVVGLLLAVSVAMEPALDWLPLAVLYGVLLLVGVASFANIQVTPPLKLLCCSTANFIQPINPKLLHMCTHWDSCVHEKVEKSPIPHTVAGTFA